MGPVRCIQADHRAGGTRERIERAGLAPEHIDNGRFVQAVHGRLGILNIQRLPTHEGQEDIRFQVTDQLDYHRAIVRVRIVQFGQESGRPPVLHLACHDPDANAVVGGFALIESLRGQRAFPERFVNGGRAAPQRVPVHDVVMDDGPGVEKFHGDRGRRSNTLFAAYGAAGEIQHAGTEDLAGRPQVAEHPVMDVRRYEKCFPAVPFQVFSHPFLTHGQRFEEALLPRGLGHMQHQATAVRRQFSRRCRLYGPREVRSLASGTPEPAVTRQGVAGI